LRAPLSASASGGFGQQNARKPLFFHDCGGLLLGGGGARPHWRSRPH